MKIFQKSQWESLLSQLNNMKNKKLEDLANRHKNPGFLEAEAHKAEDARKLKKEQRLRVQKALEVIQRDAIDSIENEARRATLIAYIDKFQGYQGSKLDLAFEAFVTGTAGGGISAVVGIHISQIGRHQITTTFSIRWRIS
jgi:hypothetical protein